MFFLVFNKYTQNIKSMRWHKCHLEDGRWKCCQNGLSANGYDVTANVPETIRGICIPFWQCRVRTGGESLNNRASAGIWRAPGIVRDWRGTKQPICRDPGDLGPGRPRLTPQIGYATRDPTGHCPTALTYRRYEIYLMHHIYSYLTPRIRQIMKLPSKHLFVLCSFNYLKLLVLLMAPQVLGALPITHTDFFLNYT